MARLIKRGKNAGVIVINTRKDADLDGAELIDLCKQAVAMRKAEESAFAQLVEDLGSVRAANAFLRQS